MRGPFDSPCLVPASTAPTLPLPANPSPPSNSLPTEPANAAHSTGPRTPEGKARSAANSRKHTFNPKIFAVVRLEQVDCVANLRSDVIAAYRPVNSQELLAIERMALAQQSILRAAAMESGLMTVCLNETMDPHGRPYTLLQDDLVHDIPVTAAQNRAYCLAEGVSRVARYSNSFSLVLRYQVQAERQYRRAVEEFDRLKALRPEMPNEPILDDQPEDNEPLLPPRPKPFSEEDYPPQPATPPPEPQVVPGLNGPDIGWSPQVPTSPVPANNP